MNKEMDTAHKLFGVLLAITGLAALPACATPVTYSAEPIEAWIVDAETKQPLENVIVVAHWALETTSRIVPHQTNSAGSLTTLETVTDKNGRFYFPAWGPKWHLGSGNLTDSDPELILFKSGYQYRRVSNSQYLRPRKYSDEGKPSGAESKPSGSKRISFWSGERIELEPFKGTLKEYANHLSLLKTSLGFAYNGDNCEWKQVPRMLAAQHREMLHFDEKQIFNTLQSVEGVSGQKKCGSAQGFFRSYLQ